MLCLLSWFQRGQPVRGWKSKQCRAFLGGGVGEAGILAEQEAEMGELEDFLQNESLLGAKPHSLKTPASPSSIASWETSVQTGAGERRQGDVKREK